MATQSHKGTPYTPRKRHLRRVDWEGGQSLLESGLRVKIYASAFVQLVFSANMPPKGGD